MKNHYIVVLEVLKVVERTIVKDNWTVVRIQIVVVVDSYIVVVVDCYIVVVVDCYIVVGCIVGQEVAEHMRDMQLAYFVEQQLVGVLVEQQEKQVL